MAKLSGPLFSLRARGQIAKTLVYAAWKGIDYARQWVIPANPKTAAQQTQRGYLTAAVARYKNIATPLNVLDVSNLNRAASVYYKALSGFNLYCMQFVSTRVAGVVVLALHNTIEVAIAAPAPQITVATGAAVVAVKLRWGHNPTSLFNVITRTEGAVAGVLHTFDFAGIVAGQVVYYEIYQDEVGASHTMGVGRFTAT